MPKENAVFFFLIYDDDERATMHCFLVNLIYKNYMCSYMYKSHQKFRLVKDKGNIG